MTGPPPECSKERRLGLVLGLCAYSFWGFIPIYFKQVAAAPPLELLAHRVVWALVLLVALSVRQGRLGELRALLAARRTLLLLGASTLLIAANWLLYIWAIVSNHVLEGSLGYFINPLVSVLLGVLVLRERLARPVIIAVLVAACGVGWLTLQSGQPPWVALSLAVTFGLYGLLRKLAAIGAVTGLLVETALLFPLAVAYLVWAFVHGRLVFLSGRPVLDLLLLAAGPVTALPLLFFTGAARRLPLSTLGFLQYVSPTLQFLLAVFLYREPFTAARGVAFACIWAALALFGLHSLRAARPKVLGSAP